MKSEDNNEKVNVKNGQKKLFVALGVTISVVLITLVVVIYMVFIAPYNGPMADIVEAAFNTVESESFTVKLEYEEDDGEIMKIDGAVAIDFEAQEIQMLTEIEDIFKDYYDGETNTYEYVLGINNGIFFRHDKKTNRTTYEDISDIITSCFEAYEEKDDYVGNSGFDFESLFDKIEEITGEYIDIDEVEDYIDLEKLNESLELAWKSMNNEEWLEKNLNYKKSKKDSMTYYSFKPDYKELAKSAEDFFEDDFEDDDLEKEFEKALDEVKQHKDNFAIRVKIGIEDDYISEVHIKHKWGNIEMLIEDVGETSIDEEVLQSYIKTPSITAKPTDKPVVTAKPTRTPKSTQIIDVKVGSYIKFGEYEQDNNPANGKENIEWIGLELKDDKALVVSRYGLDCKQYNTEYKNITWEVCTLRPWLNNDFINSALSNDDKLMIPTVTVSADKNLEYSINLDNAKQDKVFLLSITEANKYFALYSARKCKPTDYAVANGAWKSDNGNCLW